MMLCSGPKNCVASIARIAKSSGGNKTRFCKGNPPYMSLHLSSPPPTFYSLHTPTLHRAPRFHQQTSPLPSGTHPDLRTWFPRLRYGSPWFPRLPHVPPFRFNSFLLVGTRNGFRNSSLPSGTRLYLQNSSLPSGMHPTFRNCRNPSQLRLRSRIPPKMSTYVCFPYSFFYLFHSIPCRSMSFCVILLGSHIYILDFT